MGQIDITCTQIKCSTKQDCHLASQKDNHTLGYGTGLQIPHYKIQTTSVL